jgi:hypothetical protein
MAPPRNKKKTAYANERVMRPVATHPPPVAKRHFLIERYWIPYSCVDSARAAHSSHAQLAAEASMPFR